MRAFAACLHDFCAFRQPLLQQRPVIAGNQAIPIAQINRPIHAMHGLLIAAHRNVGFFSPSQRCERAVTIISALARAVAGRIVPQHFLPHSKADKRTWRTCHCDHGEPASAAPAVCAKLSTESPKASVKAASCRLLRNGIFCASALGLAAMPLKQAAVANNKMGFILGLLRGCVGCFRLPESIES